MACVLIREFHRAYVNEAQESFTDAHVRAFEHFGGVPRMVRNDNLKTTAIKILQGRSRVENDRFIGLRSHYGFESFFCEPGIGGAHEKGGPRAISAGSAATILSVTERQGLARQGATPQPHLPQ